MESPTAKLLFNDLDYHRKNVKNPSAPFVPNVILISENLVNRLETGTTEKEDIEDNDQYWAEKLADIDEEHTRRNKLNTYETERLFRSVVDYAKHTRARLCSLDHTKVRDCYMNNRCQTLQCTTEVENFISCVNKMFYKSVRTDTDLYPSNKKYTYAERFNASVGIQ